MEITERSLRSMVREVNDQHRESMTTMATDLAELHSSSRSWRASRRSLLGRVGLGGLALSMGNYLLPFERLLTPAFGQALADDDIAAFAESIELAAVEAYKAAASGGKVKTAAVGEAATMFAGHHSEHAAAFGGAAGSKASGKPNPKLLEAVSGQLKGATDEKAVLQVAFDVENAAAATYLFALGALQAPAALQLAASILPVESQHAVVLGQILGKPAADFVPGFESKEKAIDPAKFPVLS